MKGFSGDITCSGFQSHGMNAKKSGGCTQTEIMIDEWASIQTNSLCGGGTPGNDPLDAFNV